jgi:hypothetical protein
MDDQAVAAARSNQRARQLPVIRPHLGLFTWTDFDLYHLGDKRNFRRRVDRNSGQLLREA